MNQEISLAYLKAMDSIHAMEIPMTRKKFLLGVIQATYAYGLFMSKIDAEILKPSGKTLGLMFIGVNPGQASTLKDVWSDPFGIGFKKILDEVGVDHREVWMTNLYKKKTPENRPLTDKEIKQGMVFLKYEIPYVNPSKIILLGKQPAEAFKIEFKGSGTIEGFPAFSVSHPAYVARGGGEKKVEFISQLKKIIHGEQERIR